MKILELRVHSFGPFTDQSIGAPTEPDGLHIIYGPNEAGKSSARRALTGLLYGIPHNSEDDFIHSSSKLLIGGHLQLSDGRELRLLRRKGLKNTLLDENRRALDDSVLQCFLGGVGESLFSTVFCVDNETLVSGGQELLRAGGDIGQSLFGAGLGNTRLNEILNRLDTDTAALFTPKGQNREINKSLIELKSAKKKIGDLSLPSREWLEHEAALSAAQQELVNVQQELRRLDSDRNRLTRLHKAIPNIAVRKKLVSQIEELGPVVVLPSDFAVQRREWQLRLDAANDDIVSLSRDLEQLESEIASLIVPQSLLHQAETVLELIQRLGSYRQAVLDLPGLVARERQLSVDAANLAAELWPSESQQQPDEPRLGIQSRTRISELSLQKQALLVHRDSARADAMRLKKELAATTGALAALESPRDSSELRRAVAAAQKFGNIEDKLKETNSELSQEEEQARIELERLDIRGLDIRGLDIRGAERIPIPPDEMIESFVKRFEHLRMQLQGLDDRILEKRRELQECERELQELLLEGEVPTIQELTEARERRELGWQLVRREWLEKLDIEKEKRAYDAVNSLPEAYEESVRLADEKADHLRREANRVENRASLELRLASLAAASEDIEAQRAGLLRDESALRTEWEAQWTSLGRRPLSPGEMRSWKHEYQGFLNRCVRIRALEQKQKQLLAQIEECRSAILGSFERLGHRIATENSLDSLIDEGRDLSSAIEESERRRMELEERIPGLRLDLEEAQQASRESEFELRRWQEEWTEAVSILRQSGDISPAQANTVLAKLDELRKKRDEASELQGRIDQINRHVEGFKSDVCTLLQLVAQDLVELPVDQAVTELNARLNKGRTDQAKREERERQVIEKQRRLQEARDVAAAMTKRLDACCLQASCSNYDELPDREQRSADYTQLRKELEGIDRQLTELAGGSTQEALIEGADKVDADALPALIAERSSQVQSFEERRSHLLETIGGEKGYISRTGGSDAAAEAAENLQSLLASLRVQVDRYLRLRLASTVLHREIKRYRQENQERLLTRSGDFFAKMTVGSFSKLDAEVNEKGETVMLGLRGTGETVRVNGMSRGTRDQLYLALRLASIEKHVEGNEPFPFVVDDILVNFDDNRSRATLEILAELSKKTQILFFTHHLRLVELAQTIDCNGVLKLHTLGTS